MEEEVITEENVRPNMKCGSCKKYCTLDKNKGMIKCDKCGYRVLYKRRTLNYITYKTE